MRWISRSFAEAASASARGRDASGCTPSARSRADLVRPPPGSTMTTITTPHGPSESRMLANAPVDRIGCPPHPQASPPMPRTRPPTAAGIGCSAATVAVHPSRWRGADYEQVLIVPITGSLDAATVPDFAAWLRPLASHNSASSWTCRG